MKIETLGVLTVEFLILLYLELMIDIPIFYLLLLDFLGLFVFWLNLDSLGCWDRWLIIDTLECETILEFSLQI